MGFLRSTFLQNTFTLALASPMSLEAATSLTWLSNTSYPSRKLRRCFCSKAAVFSWTFPPLCFFFHASSASSNPLVRHVSFAMTCTCDEIAGNPTTKHVETACRARATGAGKRAAGVAELGTCGFHGTIGRSMRRANPTAGARISAVQDLSWMLECGGGAGVDAFVACISEIKRSRTSDLASRLVHTLAMGWKDVDVYLPNCVHRLKLPSACASHLEPPRPRSKMHFSTPLPRS